MPHSGNVTFTYVEGDDVEVEKMNGREMSQKKDEEKKKRGKKVMQGAPPWQCRVSPCQRCWRTANPGFSWSRSSLAGPSAPSQNTALPVEGKINHYISCSD